MNEIIEGHEQALWILAAGISLAILYTGLVRHWKDVRRLMEERKPEPILRDFHDRDDPYQDHNNLGRN
jgi:hypothetical protein